LKNNGYIGESKMAELAEIRKKNGVVYTPNNLACFVAEKVIDYFSQSLTSQGGPEPSDVSCLHRFHNVKIVDPACGDGELLVAAWEAFHRKMLECPIKTLLPVVTEPYEVLCGVDIDKGAVNETRRRIVSLSNMPPKVSTVNLVRANALFPFERMSSNEGWRLLERKFKAENGFDILIANPPWGADTKSYADKLSNGEFSLCRGQFDTSDLFIELALRAVKPGGYFGFIVPDSLFNRERVELRRRLLNDTQILYIGRFGEKIFKNVNRACAVIVCKNSKPVVTSAVDCVRLTPSLRRKVLSEELTFKDAERRLVHTVPQHRFAGNRDYVFDIYRKEDEQETLGLFNRCDKTFRDYLSSSRGVELSKSGKVCRCTSCNMWLPYPRVRQPVCPHCRSAITLSNVEQQRIISHERVAGYEPILVGESIKRYFLTSPYWIVTDKAGINYKDKSSYEGPKIVVRKTGVGLLAALDYQDSFTNQVVYIFKPKSANGYFFPLELLLAILNSRAIYYYLVKTHGETEWRSHPYLTQTQILDLPLPDLDPAKSQVLDAANEIVKTLKPLLLEGKGLPPAVDAEIEFLVASLYGLSHRDYERIYDTLDDVEQLLPVKALQTVSASDIFKSRTLEHKQWVTVI